MRNSLLFLICLFIFSIKAEAQITISSSDMPVAGDTFRISSASVLTPVDLTQTGANYTWDFSALTYTTQTVDSFISVASTGLVYSLFFSFGGNAANVVQKGADLTAVPGFSVTDVFNFFNRSAAAYKQVGIGANLNGLPTPIAYGNKDFIYNFPLSYTDQDSCNSDYGISLPGLGAYQAYQKRVNNVDGWGTVITPYGSFSALRIVSELSGTDSLYLDTLGTGFTLPRALSREYKWLANGEGVPVLQINTQFLAGNETVTAIRYKDSLYTVGLNGVEKSVYGAVIYPNPSAEGATLKAEYKGNGTFEILLTELSGKCIAVKTLEGAELAGGIELDKIFSVKQSGIFLIHLRGPQGTELLRWVRQ